MANFILATVAVVTNDSGQILLIQEAKPKCRGKWFFPAGKMEPDETMLEGAKREIWEESGIEIEVEGLFYIDQLTRGTSEKIYNRLRFFLKAGYKAGQLKVTEDEHSIQARWFDKEEICHLNLRSKTVLKVIDLLAQHPPMVPAAQIHLIGGLELQDEEN